ncbi:LPS export ABC transporter permease LptF [Sphingomonas sp. ID1715]|uniref:LPS export ABC transporter permease LptF n=1 Tax=Sphingomonas sp. ID1715 TaxID=1656898 RepID=UPI001489D46E|nr:LPS export ABC transporter permease LptF [Sphingomonas sp. ID1715]NNM78306.1 LPS export ABC transporter permease LptF [Sphingomonas sp. ID1715]
MLSAVDRYLARLIAVPLFATLVIAAMLLVLDKMLRLFDFVAEQGGPVSVVWRMLANLLPEYLSLGIPIGLMLGILLAFRRIATSSELDVFRAVGLSYGRLLRVPYLFTIALALLNLAIVGFVQPKARYAYEGLQFELRSGALGASIKVGEFTNLGQQMTVRIEESHKRGADLSGIFVRAESRGGRSLAVAAERGTFLRTDDPDTIIFRLRNGTLIHNEPSFRSPRVLSFTSHDLPIDLPKVERFRSRGGKERELTIPELAMIGGDRSKPLPIRNESRANFHFRIVEVAMMFLLPLLAVALAVPPKRSSSALGVFLSIVMVVTYHKVNEYAQGMGSLGRVDPLIALWVPFLIFAAIIWWLYYQLAYVPGGQPIGGLERVFAKLGSVLKRWFSIARRREARA